MHTAALTDAEIDAICSGLKQGAAMVRYLRRIGVRVQRKPNGRVLFTGGELVGIQDGAVAGGVSGAVRQAA